MHFQADPTAHLERNSIAGSAISQNSRFGVRKHKQGTLSKAMEKDIVTQAHMEKNHYENTITDQIGDIQPDQLNLVELELVLTLHTFYEKVRFCEKVVYNLKINDTDYSWVEVDGFNSKKVKKI